MKKFLIGAAFAAMCAIAVCSCNSKKDATVPLSDGLEVFENNGRLGVQRIGGSVLIDPRYDKINYDERFQVIEAVGGDYTTIFLLSGTQILVDQIDHLEQTGNKDYIRVITNDNMVYVIGLKSGKCWGRMEKIELVDEYLFFKGEDGWGAATVNLVALAPRRFDKLYILRNGDKFAVLVHDSKKSWELYDSDGVDGMLYDYSPKMLQKQIDKLKPEGDIGVLTTTLKL